MLEWIADHILEIFVTILTIAVIFFTAIAICAGMSNAANKIDEGVIIDKNYRAAYVTTMYYRTENNISIPINTTHPETYSFTIRGEKNGETVEYVFDVTETEYNNYKIGDYYKK